MVVITTINITSHNTIPVDAVGAIPRLLLPATAPIPQLWELSADSSQVPPSPENCPPLKQKLCPPGSYGSLLPRESS